MKTKKLFLAVAAAVVMMVTMTSCFFIVAKDHEVWLHNDTTWTVNDWIVVDRDSYVANPQAFTYYEPTSSSIKTIYSGGEKGLAGIPANINIMIFFTFTNDDNIYTSNSYVQLTQDCTYYIIAKKWYSRSADGTEEEHVEYKLTDGKNEYDIVKVENFSLDGANKVVVEGIE